MHLLLIRHAEALPAAAGQPDASRPLSAAGEQQAHHLARFLHRIQHCPQLILTSPYRRARQTADIIATISSETVVVEDAALSPLADPESAKNLLLSFSDFPLIACVTHQPLITTLTGILLHLSAPPLRIAPATVLFLTLSPHATPLAQLYGMLPATFTHC